VKHLIAGSSLAALVTLLWAPATPAQQSDLVFKHLSIEQGLSQSIVNAMAQDRRWFMWFVTEDGLNRFDGYTFEVSKHNAADPASLAHNEIKCVFEDRAGFLWVGSFYRGLERFDPSTKRFTHFQHDPGNPQSLSNDIVWAVLEDRAGRLWVGTGGGGLNLMDRAVGAFQHVDLASGRPGPADTDDVRVLVEDRAGALWIGTAGEGLVRLDPATGRVARFRNDPADPRSLSHDDVRAIVEDADGTLWVGTNGGGLNRLDPSAGTFSRYRHDARDRRSLSHDVVPALSLDGEGTLWVGTDGGGLNRLNRTTGGFDRFMNDPSKPASLASNRVYSLFRDRSGILWVGTYGSGVSRCDLHKKPVLHYRNDPNDSNSLSHNIVWAFCEYPAGILWVGTNDGGLSRLDRATGRWTRYSHDPRNPASIGHNSVRMVIADRAGTLWLATNGGGLDRFDPRTGVFRHYRHDPRNRASLAHDELRTVFEDRQGTIWVGTYGAGLDRWDPATEAFVHHRSDPADPKTISNDYVRTVSEDASGALWFGTHGGGLNRFDRASGTFTRYRNDPRTPGTLSNDFVFSIHEDRTGTLWVATYGGGLNRLDPKTGTFTAIRKSQGLPDDAVYGILEDGAGDLWLSTNSGLGRYTPATGAVRSYTVADGLQSNEFNGGSYYRNARGEMFFGGVNGFNIFDPAAIRDDAFKPPIVFTDFRLLDEAVAIGRMADGRTLLSRSITDTDRIELLHRDRVLSFQFAALDFASSERNRYAYKLEGLDERWSEAGTRRFVMYTTLPPGKYVLRVKGTNSDGVWNDQGASLAIVVRPPWWRTAWAYAAYLGLFAAALLGYVRFARRQEREKSRLREAELRAQAAELQSRTAEAEAKVLRLENERKTHELEAARSLQLSMLPSRVPEHPLFTVAARMRTATEVGGDYYDFYVDDEGTLTIVIGDATGHGTRAGIMVAMMKGLFTRMRAEPSLETFLDECHRTLRAIELGPMFMALGILRFKGRHGVAVGAAMPRILIYRASSRTVEEASLDGMLLGTDFDLPRVESSFSLVPGDRALLMSDGFVEQFDEADDMLDYPRCISYFKEVGHLAPESIIDHLLARLDAFRGRAPQGDDVTFVVVEARG
jgi:ligand-binding sensor domain-containing protein/serine phosphatase RsbU (regulator of sigma subunit)